MDVLLTDHASSTAEYKPILEEVERILAEAFVPLPWRKDLWAVAPYDERAYGLGSDEDGEDDYDYGYGYDEGGALYDGEERRELSEFGITNADVEEMWEYGIKPWEDDAYVRTLALLCQGDPGVLLT